MCGSGGVLESCTFSLHDRRAKRGCRLFTYIMLLILLLIDVVCYCVVSIYSTVCVAAAPCCLFHTTAHRELPTVHCQ